ncbi:MAG: hypothetical protein JWP47_1606 [Polaromonas sp.]|jgi:aminocarboxymuconate-semialdehyde decarboxylase|nr:hypothetical protein [Polaromonas sp.]
MFVTCNALNHDQCTHASEETAGSLGGDAADNRAEVQRQPGRNRIGRSSTGPLRIDIHCHYFNADAAGKAAPLKPFEKEPSIVYANPLTREINMGQMKVRGPQLSDIAVRLRDMDRMGIDVQAVSPAPAQYYYYAEADFGLELARGINDGIAAIAGAHPDRFVGIGTVPLQNAAMATRELVRCVTKLDMRGIEIGTNVNGIDLADKRLGLDKFFAKAEELGTVLFLHPMGFTHADRMTDYYFNNIIGNPLESTLAVAHLIFGGVVDRFPKLKFCVAHGGGYMPHAFARMDHGWKVRPDAQTAISRKKPSSYLKKFYFDTVTFDTGLLATLVEQVGASHVMMGSDYPFDMGDDDPVGLVERVSQLSDAERQQIMGRNAARLLKIGKSARKS